MSRHSNPPSWWGAPRKFNPNFEERRISWLELFYDLVYVIAISRITHMLCTELSVSNFLWYCSLFALIFWGWLNGSLYHDIHGNQGLRTRLMTLWQMIIISVVAVTVDHSHDAVSRDTTVALMVMQLFITYLWWSVGFYDREHRKYNRPYTVLFLLSCALLGLNLLVSPAYRPLLILGVIVFNYAPPFVASRILRSHSLDLSLSSSMTERLGLFTIIIFGEVVLGVVNGVSRVDQPGMNALLVFMLSLAIVFSLWWIFFTLISNRNARAGFVTASLLELLYIPALISLGVTAASFTLILDTKYVARLHGIICVALGVFSACISVMMGLLVYPEELTQIRKKVRSSLFATAAVFLLFSVLAIRVGPVCFLLLTLVILLTEIIYLNSLYYSLYGKTQQTED